MRDFDPSDPGGRLHDYRTFRDARKQVAGCPNTYAVNEALKLMFEDEMIKIRNRMTEQELRLILNEESPL